MLSLKQAISNRVIRKGDYFGIYIDITNGYDFPILISEIKLVAPMGFSQPKEQKTKKEESSVSGTRMSTQQDLVETIHPHRKIEREFVFILNQAIDPKFTYRHEINLRAGHWAGSHPKPDTHLLSIKIDYKHASNNSNSLQEQMNVPISIFPSFSSMIIGTLVGGVLGTLAGERFMTTSEGDNPSIELSPAILPILFVNLIFSFIGGVILMRRKDVQSFITIEDFWGGILLGFVVGYAGFEGLIRLFGLPIDQSANTDAAGNITGA